MRDMIFLHIFERVLKVLVSLPVEGKSHGGSKYVNTASLKQKSDSARIKSFALDSIDLVSFSEDALEASKVYSVPSKTYKTYEVTATATLEDGTKRAESAIFVCPPTKLKKRYQFTATWSSAFSGYQVKASADLSFAPANAWEIIIEATDRKPTVAVGSVVKTQADVAAALARGSPWFSWGNNLGNGDGFARDIVANWKTTYNDAVEFLLQSAEEAMKGIAADPAISATGSVPYPTSPTPVVPAAEDLVIMSAEPTVPSAPPQNGQDLRDSAIGICGQTLKPAIPALVPFISGATNDPAIIPAGRVVTPDFSSRGGRPFIDPAIIAQGRIIRPPPFPAILPPYGVPNDPAVQFRSPAALGMTPSVGPPPVFDSANQFYCHLMPPMFPLVGGPPAFVNPAMLARGPDIRPPAAFNSVMGPRAPHDRAILYAGSKPSPLHYRDLPTMNPNASRPSDDDRDHMEQPISRSRESAQAPAGSGFTAPVSKKFNAEAPEFKPNDSLTTANSAGTKKAGIESVCGPAVGASGAAVGKVRVEGRPSSAAILTTPLVGALANQISQIRDPVLEDGSAHPRSISPASRSTVSDALSLNTPASARFPDLDVAIFGFDEKGTPPKVLLPDGSLTLPRSKGRVVYAEQRISEAVESRTIRDYHDVHLEANKPAVHLPDTKSTAGVLQEEDASAKEAFFSKFIPAPGLDKAFWKDNKASAVTSLAATTCRQDGVCGTVSDIAGECVGAVNTVYCVSIPEELLEEAVGIPVCKAPYFENGYLYRGRRTSLPGSVEETTDGEEADMEELTRTYSYPVPSSGELTLPTDIQPPDQNADTDAPSNSTSCTGGDGCLHRAQALPMPIPSEDETPALQRAPPLRSPELCGLVCMNMAVSAGQCEAGDLGNSIDDFSILATPELDVVISIPPLVENTPGAAPHAAGDASLVMTPENTAGPATLWGIPPSKVQESLILANDGAIDGSRTEDADLDPALAIGDMSAKNEPGTAIIMDPEVWVEVTSQIPTKAVASCSGPATLWDILVSDLPGPTTLWGILSREVNAMPITPMVGDGSDDRMPPEITNIALTATIEDELGHKGTAQTVPLDGATDTTLSKATSPQTIFGLLSQLGYFEDGEIAIMTSAPDLAELQAAPIPAVTETAIHTPSSMSEPGPVIRGGILSNTEVLTKAPANIWGILNEDKLILATATGIAPAAPTEATKQEATRLTGSLPEMQRETLVVLSQFTVFTAPSALTGASKGLGLKPATKLKRVRVKDVPKTSAQATADMTAEPDTSRTDAVDFAYPEGHPLRYGYLPAPITLEVSVPAAVASAPSPAVTTEAPGATPQPTSDDEDPQKYTTKRSTRLAMQEILSQANFSTRFNDQDVVITPAMALAAIKARVDDLPPPAEASPKPRSRLFPRSQVSNLSTVVTASARTSYAPSHRRSASAPRLPSITEGETLEPVESLKLRHVRSASWSAPTTLETVVEEDEPAGEAKSSTPSQAHSHAKSLSTASTTSSAIPSPQLVTPTSVTAVSLGIDLKSPQPFFALQVQPATPVLTATEVEPLSEVDELILDAELPSKDGLEATAESSEFIPTQQIATQTHSRGVGVTYELMEKFETWREMYAEISADPVIDAWRQKLEDEEVANRQTEETNVNETAAGGVIIEQILPENTNDEQTSPQLPSAAGALAEGGSTAEMVTEQEEETPCDECDLVFDVADEPTPETSNVASGRPAYVDAATQADDIPTQGNNRPRYAEAAIQTDGFAARPAGAIQTPPTTAEVEPETGDPPKAIIAPELLTSHTPVTWPDNPTLDWVQVAAYEAAWTRELQCRRRQRTLYLILLAMFYVALPS